MSTVIQSGKFIADGLPKTIALRSDVDWMEVINYTNWIGTTADQGAKYYWQRGMAAGRGLVQYHAAADDTTGMSEIAAGGGFTLYDSSTASLGAAVAVTNVTAAAPPLVLTGATAGLVANSSIIRLVDITGGAQLGGIDFSVGAVVGNTSAALAHLPQPVAATTDFYRIVSPSNMFYPDHRHITAISKAASAVVVTSVTNDYEVGQMLRFIVPAAFGMTEMNGLVGTITAVVKTGATGANTITVDIDSTGFTTFAFPATAASPFSPAMCMPVGMSATQAYANNLDGAVYNRATIGMILSAGANAGVLSPSGSAAGTGDVMYWRAGKSLVDTDES